MSILSPESESTMYSTIVQAQLAVGTSMQKGLKIPITQTQCMEPQPWNKLEIPETLNGEGVAIAIMASQGGFLLFIPDDGILLPAGYASTLSDPTEPLPVMAGELQRKLLPNAPGYVGKRIGRAKVFSSMARRAGIDDSALILPVKLIIGNQESHIWFVGDVPHPERAFAKRNPESELRKKSKLFSDEILSNYSDQTDFASMFSAPESNKDVESVSMIDSETDLSFHGGKNNRQKADLNRLLALKKNYGNELHEVKFPKTSSPSEPETKLMRVDSPHTPSIHLTIPSVETPKTEPVESDVITDTPAQSVLTKTAISINDESLVEEENAVESVDVSPLTEQYTNPAVEEIIQTTSNQSDSIVQTAIVSASTQEKSAENRESQTLISENVSEVAEIILPEEQEQPLVESIPENTIPESSVTEQADVVTTSTVPVNHVLLSMTVQLEAILSQRRFSLNEIVRWKPGSVIEFGDFNSTVNLSAKNVTLTHGQPVENNSRIGLQLK